MNKVEKIFNESTTPAEYAKKYLTYLAEVLGKMDCAPIAKFIEAIENTRKTGNQTIFLGNGGSAATASHFANDVMAGPRCWDNPYRAISLTDNVALITAIGNDHGYEHIFELQLRALMKPGDVVVAISASGNSPNVIKAVDYANKNKGITVGLTGFDGGELLKKSQISIHVPTAKGEYGPVEDIHMVIDHLLGGYLVQANRNVTSIKKTA